jgi:tetratricopeptide (TPR) repeat protein
MFLVIALCFFAFILSAQHVGFHVGKGSNDPNFTNRDKSYLLKKPHYWYNLGFKASENGNFQEAFDDFTKAISLDSAYAAAYNCRGTVRCYLKEYYKAIMDFDSAIKYAPNEASAYNNRAAVFEQLNMLKVAIRDYQKAVNLVPSIRRYQLNLENALEKDTVK